MEGGEGREGGTQLVLFLMSSKALTAILTLSSWSSRPPSMDILVVGVGGVEKKRPKSSFHH